MAISIRQEPKAEAAVTPAPQPGAADSIVISAAQRA